MQSFDYFKKLAFTEPHAYLSTKKYPNELEVPIF